MSVGLRLHSFHYVAVHGPEIKRGFGLEENTKAGWGLGGTHYGGLQNVRSPIIDPRHII